MKDIDFDELDKAVSSVLGNESKPTSGHVPVTAGQAAIAVPQRTSLSVSPADQTDDNSKPPAPLSPAVRRGRFMDVVHPSSDMTAVSTATKPALVQPLAPDTSTLTDQPPEIITEVTPVESSAAAMAATEPKLDTIESPGVANESPVKRSPRTAAAPPREAEATHDDPVLTMVEDDTTLASPTEQPQKEAAKAPGRDEFDDLTVDKVIDPADTTAGTPFLPDTRVDKRPLGAFNDGEADEGASLAASSVNLQTIDIEAMDSTEQLASPHPSSASDENHADDTKPQHLFDSESYPAPLAKKKNAASIWLWIVLVIALLAAGSALGYFWYVNGF